MASLNDIFSCIFKTLAVIANLMISLLVQSFVNSSILPVIFSAAFALAQCIVSAI